MFNDRRFGNADQQHQAPEMTLGDLLAVKKGQTYEAGLTGENGPYLLGMGIFSPDGGFRPHKLRRYAGPVRIEAQAKPGAVVVATTDMGANIKILGRSAKVPDWIGDFAVVAADMGLVEWRTEDSWARSYAYWVMRTEQFRQYCLRFARGTAVRRVHTKDIESFPILDPREPRILPLITALDALDDKIELHRRMNETLEAIARAFFKSWFMDFDPVRAKAEGLDPGLPKPLADLFPDSFEDSELGEIPKGWRVGTLGEVAEHPRRGVQPKEIKPTIPYIALEHMPRRCIALSEWDTADGLESNKFEFKRGEILFGKLRPYFHKVGVAPVDGVCSTDIVVVAPRAQEWFGFVLGNVSSDAFVEYTNAGSTGTKMPRTSWGDMARYALVIPPDNVAEAFTSQIRPAVDHIIASIHESRTLAALRDTLLPKLLSGELRLEGKRA